MGLGHTGPDRKAAEDLRLLSVRRRASRAVYLGFWSAKRQPVMLESGALRLPGDGNYFWRVSQIPDACREHGA